MLSNLNSLWIILSSNMDIIFSIFLNSNILSSILLISFTNKVFVFFFFLKSFSISNFLLFPMKYKLSVISLLISSLIFNVFWLNINRFSKKLNSNSVFSHSKFENELYEKII